MAFCSSCGSDLTGMFCAKCGTHASGQAMAIAPPPATDWRTEEIRRLNRRVQTDRHGFPALLSFFIPGLGQMVKGQFLTGIGVMVVAAMCAGLCVVGIGIPMLAVFWIWQLYDAYVRPDAALADEIERMSAQPPKG